MICLCFIYLNWISICIFWHMPCFWPSVSLPGIRFHNQFSCRRWCQSHRGIWLPWSAGPKVSQQNSDPSSFSHSASWCRGLPRCPWSTSGARVSSVVALGSGPTGQRGQWKLPFDTRPPERALTWSWVSCGTGVLFLFPPFVTLIRLLWAGARRHDWTGCGQLPVSPL